MNTDIFFRIGTTHKVCQDYAFAGPDYVILSDGCSGERDTDFGSRLLVRSAVQQINSFHNIDPQVFFHRTLSTAAIACRTIGLPDSSLCATLLCAKVDGDVLRYCIVGDGAIAIRYDNGVTKIMRVIAPATPHSMPFYLRYCLNESSWENYKNVVGFRYTYSDTWMQPDGTTSERSVEVRSDPAELNAMFLVGAERTRGIESVALMSDGVDGFVTTCMNGTALENVPVDGNKVIFEALAFKSCTGEFVNRRLTKAFKSFEKDGWQNTDDFSLAAIARIGE